MTTERKYPTRPASEVDPTGAFERAYAEVAGVGVDVTEVLRNPSPSITGEEGEAAAVARKGSKAK